MNITFDYSQLMQQTGAVEVILDKPRRMRYDLAAITEFQNHFGMTVKEWLKARLQEGKEPSADDVYYIAWLGFHSCDKELTLDQFCAMVPWPVLNKLYEGPVLLALIGYDSIEGNSHRAAEAGRLPFMRSLASLLGWSRRKRGRQPQKT